MSRWKLGKDAELQLIYLYQQRGAGGDEDELLHPPNALIIIAADECERRERRLLDRESQPSGGEDVSHSPLQDSAGAPQNIKVMEKSAWM